MVKLRVDILITAMSVALLTVGGGCQIMKTNNPYLCQVVVGNRSDKVLSSVIVDPKGVAIDFGFLGKGNPKSLKGAGYQRIRFADDVAIAWEENNVPKKTLVEIRQYEGKRDQIESFSFFYLGNGKWQILAQDGITLDAKEIKP